MNYNNWIRTIAIVLLCTLPGILNAQILTRKHNRRNVPAPKAVLAMYRTSSNVVKQLDKLGNHKKADEIRRDNDKMTQTMMLDYHDNFSYCPVYFFADTNLNLVKQQKFKNILYNADGSPAKNVNISPADTNYIIVYFGYEQPDMKHNVPAANYLALVIYDYKFVQYRYPSPYQIVRIKKIFPQGKYNYVSKKYDIEYYKNAASLDYQLRDYFQ